MKRWVALVLCALSSACSGDSGSSGRQESSDGIASLDRIPTVGLVNRTVRLARSEQIAALTMVNDCMAALGYATMPLPAVTESSSNAQRYGFTTEALAEPPEDDVSSPPWVSGDAQVAYMGKPDEGVTFVIAVGEETEEVTIPGGCAGDALRQIYGTDDAIRAKYMTEAEIYAIDNESWTTAIASSEAQVVIASWRRCMEVGGYTAVDPLTVPGHDDPGGSEVMLRADLECQREVGYVETHAGIEERWQRDFEAEIVALSDEYAVFELAVAAAIDATR